MGARGCSMEVLVIQASYSIGNRIIMWDGAHLKISFLLKHLFTHAINSHQTKQKRDSYEP